MICVHIKVPKIVLLCGLVAQLLWHSGVGLVIVKSRV